MRMYIDAGVSYIQQEQLSSGGFISNSRARTQSKKSIPYKTTFFPSLILNAITQIQSSDAKTIKTNVKKFLLRQASENWSLNYWDRNCVQYSSLPYPDDLDDTFTALSGLALNFPDLIDGDALGKITQLLFATETQAGGPYRTWLVDKSVDSAWLDTDLAVNCNIGHFLHLQKVRLSNLEQLITDSIKNNCFSSPYYLNEYPLIYFASRWVKGDTAKQLLKFALSKNPQTIQSKALFATALMNLGQSRKKIAVLIDDIVASQNKDGSWDEEPFCIDPQQDDKQFTASAQSLTTALCIESLNIFSSKQEAQKKDNSLYKEIVSQLRTDAAHIGHNDLQKQVLRILADILKQDKDKQILLLPYMIAKELNFNIDSQVAENLAQASAWGWMAYTTYDDFLDNEGNINLLSGANVCMRNTVDRFRAALPNNMGFQTEVSNLLLRTDAANAWEVAHCRKDIELNHLTVKSLPDYGDYWQLADRSIGHVLSALGVLFAIGYARDSKEIVNFKKFFKHYLIARQLNDDAHDWLADLRQGHINAVAVKIIQLANIDSIDTNQTTELELLFWKQAIDPISDEIINQTTLAKQALDHAGLRLPAIEKLLDSPLQAAKLALHERNKHLNFIKQLA